ncbi:TPA: PspC domain-containing protein [Enterococcus faecium]
MMKKKLTKSNKNVVLTGTLAGIGEYIGIDPTVIRVLYVFLSLVAFGSPIILYILLALIIPSARSARTNYGHNNAYYEKNFYREQTREQTKKRKEAEKIDDDEWSDF